MSISGNELREVFKKHRPVHVSNPNYSPEKDNIIQGWTECACGKAKADPSRLYEEVWADHMVEVFAAESRQPAGEPLMSQEEARVWRLRALSAEGLLKLPDPARQPPCSHGTPFGEYCGYCFSVKVRP